MIDGSDDNDDHLDGCDLDFTEPSELTQDGEEQDALAMFADVWDDDAAVEQRRVDLIELDEALRG